MNSADLSHALTRKHYPSGDILTELKRYASTMRDTSEKCRKEWQESGDAINTQFHQGRWDAYHGIIRMIEELEVRLTPT